MSLRFFLMPLALCGFVSLCSTTVRAQQTAAKAATANPAPAPKLTTPNDASAAKVADAVKFMDNNDVDAAMAALTDAIQLNPRNTGALVLRGSVYCQKKLWPQAEQDFRTAAQIAPTNVVLKFQIVDVKFLAKDYNGARPGFVALEKDPDMGDFASYQVFLCDLMGGHEAAASKELDVFNDVGSNPSYYFSNAAWELYHKHLEKGRGWLVSASNVFALRKNQFYAQSLRDIGYLPLPPPADN